MVEWERCTLWLVEQVDDRMFPDLRLCNIYSLNYILSALGAHSEGETVPKAHLHGHGLTIPSNHVYSTWLPNNLGRLFRTGVFKSTFYEGDVDVEYGIG